MAETGVNKPCPIVRVMEILGERWTVLILRDLFMHGPRRFQDFTAAMNSLSPTTLSARLKLLEKHGIIARQFYETHPPRAEYFLTAKGQELAPALNALLVWGDKYTAPADIG